MRTECVSFLIQSPYVYVASFGHFCATLVLIAGSEFLNNIAQMQQILWIAVIGDAVGITDYISAVRGKIL